MWNEETSAQIATRCHGTRTWDYKQTGFQTKTAAIFNKQARYTYKGVCAALCVSWVKEHASGNSLANKLGGGSGRRINKAVLADIVALQAAWKGGKDVRAGSELRKHGFTKIWTGNYSSGSSGAVVIRGLFREMVNKFRNYQDCYVLIHVDGMVYHATAGHLMCMFIDANQNVLFFDPNHGEFSFTSMYDFCDFFLDYTARNYYNFRRDGSLERYRAP